MDGQTLALMVPGICELLVILFVGACIVMMVALPVACVFYVMGARQRAQQQVDELTEQVESLRRKLGEDDGPSQ